MYWKVITWIFGTIFECVYRTHYRPFFSPDYARCSQLHKWLTTYVKKSDVSRRGIEHICIEILFYPEVEEEHIDAVTKEENTLDETAPDKLKWIRQGNYNITWIKISKCNFRESVQCCNWIWCNSAQQEDFVELFTSKDFGTKVFSRYAQDKWPTSSLVVSGIVCV